MLRKESRQFAAQFQWEVDRMVFRHRQRGAPVETSEEERDRMIARFEERFRTAHRAIIASAFLTAFLYSFFAAAVSNPMFVIVPAYGGVALCALLLQRWAFDSPTAQLRERPAIGEPLGATGGYLRAVAAVPTQNLWGGLIYLTVVGWLFRGAFSKDELLLPTIVFGLAGGGLLLALVAKAALATRDRLRRRDRQLMERARGLRAD